jgi:hypothetical protein
MKKLNIDELEDRLDLNTINKEIKPVIEIFLAAINDWPEMANDLNDYEIQVRRFVNGETTKSQIIKRKIEIDYSRHAWQAESLAQILEVFSFYEENLSLREIINDLESRIDS